MESPAKTFITIIEALEDHYGTLSPPPPQNAFQWILWDNIAYLVRDDRRRMAFETLRERVGLRPRDLLSASSEVLEEVTKTGGIHHVKRASRLQESARICFREHGEHLDSVLELPLPKARSRLTRFPAIGKPGAEKILLFTSTHPVLALDSNGLRTLLRLGFGLDQGSYAAQYRSVQEHLSSLFETDNFPLLQKAHLLLQHHGRQLCKNSHPRCTECPLRSACAYYSRPTS